MARVFAVDAGEATATGADLSCLAGCSGAGDNNRRGPLACAHFRDSADNGIWACVSGCYDSLAGVHANVDTLSAFRSAVAFTQPSFVEGSANDWHYCRFDCSDLVRAPQMSGGISMESK